VNVAKDTTVGQLVAALAAKFAIAPMPGGRPGCRLWDYYGKSRWVIRPRKGLEGAAPFHCVTNVLLLVSLSLSLSLSLSRRICARHVCVFVGVPVTVWRSGMPSLTTTTSA